MMNRTTRVNESKTQSILAWIEVGGIKVKKLTELADGVICYKLINTLVGNNVNGKSKCPKARPVILKNRVRKRSKRITGDPLKHEVEKKLDYGVDEPLEQEKKEEDEVGYLNHEPMKQDAVEKNEFPMGSTTVSKEIPSESMDFVNGESSNDSQKTVEAEPYEFSNNVDENNSTVAEKDEIVQERCVQVSSMLSQIDNIGSVPDSVLENIVAFNNSENKEELSLEERYEVIKRFIENVLELSTKYLVNYSDCINGDEMEIAKMTTLLLSALVQYAISADQTHILESFNGLTEDNQEQIKEFLDYFLNVKRSNPNKTEFEKILSHAARPKRSCRNPSEVVPQVTPRPKKTSKRMARKSSANECFDTPIKSFLYSPNIRKSTPDLYGRVSNAVNFRDKRLFELEDRLEEEKENVTDLKKKIEKMDKCYDELKKQHDSLKNAYDYYEAESEEKKTALKNENQEKQRQIESLRVQITELNGHIALLRNKDEDDLTKSSGKSSSMKKTGIDLESFIQQLFKIIREQKENEASGEVLSTYDENNIRRFVTEEIKALRVNRDEEIEALKKSIKETQALKESKDEEIEALKESKDEEIDALKKSIDKIEALNQIKEFEMAKKDEIISNLEKALKNCHERIWVEKDQDINHLQADYLMLQSEKEELERRILQIPNKNLDEMRQDEINQMNETVAKLGTEIKSLDEEKKNLEKEKEKQIKALTKSNRDLKKERKYLENIDKKNKALTDENLKLKCEIAALKETLLPLSKMSSTQSQVSQKEEQLGQLWTKYDNTSTDKNDSPVTVEPPVDVNILSSPLDHSITSGGGLRKSVQRKNSVNAESSHGGKNGKLSCTENEFNKIKTLVRNLAKCIKDINNQSSDVLAHIENIAINLSGVKDLIRFLVCVTDIMSNYVHSNMLLKHKNKDLEYSKNCTLCEKNKDLLNGKISELQKKVFQYENSSKSFEKDLQEWQLECKTLKNSNTSLEANLVVQQKIVNDAISGKDEWRKKARLFERKYRENKPLNCKKCAILTEQLSKHKDCPNKFRCYKAETEDTLNRQKNEISKLTNRLETATEEKLKLQNKLDYIKRFQAATYDNAVMNSLADRIPCPADVIPDFTEESDKDAESITSVESTQSVVAPKSSKDKSQRFGNFCKVEDEGEMLSQSSIASSYPEDRLKEYMRRNSMVPRDQICHYATELDMTQTEEKFHPPITTTNGKYIPCPKLKPNNNGWNFGQNGCRARPKQVQDSSTNSYKKFKVSENESTAVSSRFTASIYSKKPKPQLISSTPKIKVPPRIIFSTKRKPKQV